MKLRDYLSTYSLVRQLNQYRDRQQKEMVNKDNEYCENYFREDDMNNDGRGSF